jgi:hypothetical protein
MSGGSSAVSDPCLEPDPVSSWKNEDDEKSFSASQNDVMEHCAPQARASGKGYGRGTVFIGMEACALSSADLLSLAREARSFKLIVLAPANADEAVRNLSIS